jgi:hypothetical protein
VSNITLLVENLANTRIDLVLQFLKNWDTGFGGRFNPGTRARADSYEQAGQELRGPKGLVDVLELERTSLRALGTFERRGRGFLMLK